MNSWKPDIFAYLDYRAYLRDFYDRAKEHSRVYSFRYLARRAGFSSPNFIKLVMDGKRNLGDASIEPVAKALDLDEDESSFFHSLVIFDQAATAEQKNEVFEQIAASRRFRNARRIDHNMFEYLSHWYYPAIRELSARPDFRPDPAWISPRLHPKVPEAQVARAIELLYELEVLIPDEDGTCSRGQPSLTTGHEVGSLAIGNFHRQMMSKAAESIESTPRTLRDISGLTVCVSESLIPEIKNRIHQFRESLLELCDSDEGPEVVYQINFQLFPLTKNEPEE